MDRTIIVSLIIKIKISQFQQLYKGKQTLIIGQIPLYQNHSSKHLPQTILYKKLEKIFCLDITTQKATMNQSRQAGKPNPYLSPNQPLSYTIRQEPFNQTQRIPQSLLYPSTTPRKQILVRNQSFQNRQYNEDLIQLIAKIRSLQDDLIQQRFKNESLQKKLAEYERIIDNLEYENNAQSYELQKYMHEIQLSNEKNLEILKYEQNLRIVGEEIEELNNVLVLKNEEFDIISQKNNALYNQVKRLEEQLHVQKLNFTIVKKQLLDLLTQCSSINHEQSTATKINTSQYNQSINQSGTNHQTLPKAQPFTSNQTFSSPTHYTPIQELSKSIQLIKTLIFSIYEQKCLLSQQSQEQKKQLTNQLIKQKQKYIKLQYEHRLLEQRQKDSSRKQDLISTHYNQQKVEETIAEMMKKEDQYIQKIQELQFENQRLNQQLKEQQENFELSEKVFLQEKASIVQNLRKQNQLLQQTIGQLNEKNRSLEAGYESIIAQKFQQIQLQAENSLKIAKKGRKVEEQNYQYQIKIQELTGQNKLLKRQLAILRGQEQSLLQKQEQSIHQQ